MRPGRRRKLEPESDEALAEKAKASVRAKVEHPFLKVKRLFGYVKVRYRGLAKNLERLALLFGLGNLLTAEGSTVGVVRPAAGPNRPYGPRQAPDSAVKGETQGLSADQQRPDDSSRPLRPPVKQNSKQNGLVQGIPRPTIGIPTEECAHNRRRPRIFEALARNRNRCQVQVYITSC